VHRVAVKELLLTGETNQSSSLLSGVVHWVRAGFEETRGTVHGAAELAVLQFLVILDAVVALSGAQIPLISPNFIAELEDLVLFSEKDEVVLLHFDLLDLFNDGRMILV
jgi:hypothetical protein